MRFRVGLGFDIHPFGDGDGDGKGGSTLVLGGVTIDGAARLAGHSDGDAIAHAVSDAILGAAGAGDIGEHFSDRDPKNAGRNSVDILRVAAKLVADRGYRVVQADVTIITESPRLEPRKAERACFRSPPRQRRAETRVAFALPHC